MGLPNETSPFALGSTGGYEIDQSLRFNSADSAYLNRTAGTPTDNKKWTWSAWAKISGASQALNFASSASGTSMYFGIETGQGNNFIMQIAGTRVYKSTAIFRDPSSWYHFVFVFDSANATQADRSILYVNGVRQAATTASVTLNQTTGFNAASTGMNLGYSNAWSATSADYFSGYLTEINFIDGSALDPTDFGEYDNNGVWIPKKYSGSYGTNGFYLTFDPSATNGIGHDHSGNGNNWTPSGFTTSGTGTDVMSDTPTTNWATFNPLHRFTASNGNYSPALSKGNLAVSGPSYQGIGRSTIVMSSGKFYFEATITYIDPDALVGIYKVPFGEGTVFWQQATQATYYSGTGVVQYPATTTVQTYSTYTTGDVIGVALDLDNGKVFFSKNGTWQGSSDPAAGTNPAVSGLTGEWTFGATAGSPSAITTANFGQRAFAYTPPTGFKALNTDNLSAPAIADGSQYFNTKPYTGNGSTQTITNVNFQPDLVWVKSRSQTQNHLLFDAIRGFASGNELSPDNGNAEGQMSTNLYG
jgi:hypothetical protein